MPQRSNSSITPSPLRSPDTAFDSSYSASSVHPPALTNAYRSSRSNCRASSLLNSTTHVASLSMMEISPTVAYSAPPMDRLSFAFWSYHGCDRSICGMSYRSTSIRFSASALITPLGCSCRRSYASSPAVTVFVILLTQLFSVISAISKLYRSHTARFLR